jgi:hypothetical protein
LRGRSPLLHPEGAAPVQLEKISVTQAGDATEGLP